MNILDPHFVENSVLKGLNASHLQALNDCASVVHFKPGEILFERGKESDRFFLIMSGKVNVELYTPERGPRPIQTLGSGDLLGTSWILSPSKWRSDARAVTATEALSFNAHMVREKCATDQQLGYELMSRFFIAISTRLEAAQNQILAMYAGKT